MTRRHEFARTAGAFAVLFAGVTACGERPTGTMTPSPTVASTLPSPAATIRQEFVTVAGGQLELWCEGEGPTVMLLSGSGGDGSLIPIGTRLGGDAYACNYNRPGDGQGPPPDRPRTAGSDAIPRASRA